MMPRLIDVETIDGSQLSVTPTGTTLTIWEKGADGSRVARFLEGDEAVEAAVEVKEWLAGTNADGEPASDVKPARTKAKKGA